MTLPPPERPLGPLHGRVVDPGGNPIAGATIHAEHDRTRSRGSLPPQDTTSDATGAFRFEQIALGAYTLQAKRFGLAQTARRAVNVIPAETAAVELVMESGATVVGTIAGLSPGELRNAYVRAFSWETAPAVVREDGSFRLENVGRGPQGVMAGTPGRRRSEARFNVPADADTVSVRVEFAAGLSLRGRVFFRGQPASGGGMTLYGSSAGDRESRSLPLAADGAYQFDALPAGEYRLWVGPAVLQSPFVVDGIVVGDDTDLDIDVRGGVLAGRIVDAETGAGLDNARLRLRPQANLGSDTYPTFPPVALDGTFHVGPLTGVPWRIEASAEGYAPTILEVPLDNEDIEDLVLEIERTSGLLLNLAPPPGYLPERVRMSWLSLDGERSFRRSLSPQGVAEYHWDDIPMGPGVLTLADRGGGRILRREIDNRGQMIDATLEPAGFLDLLIQGLADTARGDVRVFDDAGRELPDLPLGIRPNAIGDIDTRRWRRLIGLAPGAYTVEVTGPGGAQWRSPFEVRAGETVSVTLR